MRVLTLLKGTLLSVALYAGTASAEPITTAEEAVAYLLDSGKISDTSSLRIAEMVEHNSPAILRWRFSFVSEEILVAIKVDGRGETEELARFENPSIYNPIVYAPLPSARDIPDGQAFIDKGRALIQAANSDSTVEPGHIIHYKICIPAKVGKTPKFENGCRRSKHLREWKVYFKVTQPDQDWLVKEVVFADDLRGVVNLGPRGFFE